MATSKLQSWKISVDTRVKGFHFRLKVSNALSSGWVAQSKSSLLRVSLRAKVQGAICRIKVAASKALSKCGDQHMKWKNVRCLGEFRFKQKFLKIKGYLVDAKAKPKLRDTSYGQSESCTTSYCQCLRNMIFPQKKTRDCHNASNNSGLEFIEAQLTSLMGNLCLLSYFVGKKERGATIVQAVGVVTTLIVLLQLAIAGAMPLPTFVATAVACLIGFVVNALNYGNLITDAVWKVWIEIIGVGGLYVLTQVIWSTFVPYLPKSILPGIIIAVLYLLVIELARWEWLPGSILNIAGGISGWTATLLFMWSPVSQLYTNIRNPANLHGLSVFTILLALIGNGMLIPRALFIRDVMWFTGASWGSTVQGWGILLSMYLYKAATSYLFWGVTFGFALWLGVISLGDMYAYSLKNPLEPFIELLKDKRKYEISK